MDQLLGYRAEITSQSLRHATFDVIKYEHERAVQSLRQTAQAGGLSLADPEAEVSVSELGVEDAPAWTYAWRPETAGRVREEVLRRVEQIEHPPMCRDGATGVIVGMKEPGTPRVSLRVTAVGTPLDEPIHS